MERRNKLTRSPSMKRRSKPTPLSDRVTLERVLGLTLTNNCGLASSPVTGVIAYPAGCVVVLFNTKKNKQSHIFNTSRKTISALAFSKDGKYVVTGESGHQPGVRVWDVEEKTQVAEFQGHKFGVSCVAFSSNMKYVVSVGYQHDMLVNVWNWRTSTLVASNKVSSKVKAMSFSEDSSYFVTVGNRHVKFWYLDESKASKNLGTVPLLGRSGILGEQRNNFFCDVACGRGMMKESTYCITRSGLLCEFNERRLLDKWVELRTTCANCISVSENHIACGCADGVVRLFDPKTLHYICTLPKPHYLGLDVAASIDPSQFITKNDNAKYPSTIAVKYDEQNNKVTCVYDDHSLYVWDVKDEKKIGKAWSFLYHSSCVWGVETYPNVPEGFKAALPAGSFITCGSDDTIRIWNLDSTLHTDTVLKRNIYSNELLKVIYTDESYQNIRDVDYNPAGSNDKTDDSYGGKNGVRCVKVSPDGQHLASGDRCGNIRVHELQFMDQLKYLEAHDGEVLCLEYANPDQTGLNLLASSSRDRLIHIFQADRNYSLLQTLDDHSAAITAVKFTDHNGQLQMLSCGADKALMFRSLQQGPTNTNTDMQFIRNHYILGKCTFYDMDVDITKKYVATACQDRNVRIFNTNSGKLKKGYKGSLGDDGTLIKVQLDPSGMYAVTSCSDKNLSIYDFYSGECVATMFGHSELVTGVKFTPDLKRLISTSGDGCIFVWKLSPVFTQTMKDRLAELGQQLPTDVPKINIRRDTFAVTDSPCRRETYAVLPNNGPSSVPTTANGHPSPPDLDITAPLLQHDLGLTESDFAPARPSLFQKSPEPHLKPEAANVGPEFDYRFSVLPSWAKKQGVEEEVSKSASDTYSSPSQPRGRWAQRVDDGGIRVKSQLDAEASISLSLTDALERRRLTVEPDSMRDTLKGMAAERGTTGDLLESVQEGLSFSLGMSLDQFEKELQSKTPAKQLLSQVGANRNSEPFERPTRLTLNFDRQTSTEVGLHIEDIEGDAEAGDDTGNIIYPAPSQDLIITPDSPFLVKEYFPMGMKKKKLGAETPRKEPEDTGADTGESQEEDSGSNDPDSLEEDGEGDDEEEEEEEDGGGDSLENSEAEEDRISRSLTPSSSSEKPDSETSPQTPEKERFLKHNYENLEVSAALGNETFGRSLDELKPAAEADHFLNPRLSISARFLSRSQQGVSLKRFLPMASVTESGKEIHPVVKTTTANDENLQKKKEEMAMAVDQTRKRLEAMGYKLERASSTESINSEPTRDLTIPVKASQPKPVTLESHSYSESSGSVSTSRSTTPSSTAGAGTASKASSGVDVPLDIPEKLPSSPSSPPTPSADKENQVFPDTKGGAKSVAKATKQKPVTKSMSMSDLAQKSKSDTKVEACNSPGTHSMTLRARVSQSQPGSPSKPRTLPLPPAKSEPNLADAKDIKKSTKERRRSSLTKDKVSRRSSGSAVAAKARGRSRRSEPLSSAISNPNLATEQGTDKVVKPVRGSVVRRNSVGSCVSRKTSDKSESTKTPSVNVVPPSPTRKSDLSLEADSSDNAEADRRAMPPPPAGFVSVSKAKSEVKKPQHAEPKIKSKSDPRQKSSLKEKAAKRKVMSGAVSPPVNKMAAQPPKTKQSELVAGTTPGPSQRPPIETLQPVSCDQGPTLAVSSDIDEIPERDTSHPRTSHSDSEVLETYDVHASEGPEWLEAWKKCKKADTPTQPLALDTQPPVVASCITLTSPSRTSKPSPPMPLDITDIIQINLPPAARKQDGPVALQGIGPAVKKDEGQGDGNDVHVQELPARQQEPTVALSKAAPQTKVQGHAFLPVKHSANAATEVPQQGVMEQTEQPEKDSPVSVEMCSQVVEDLRRTFQKAASLHARALQSEVQHKDEVLSMLSATFSSIQSQVTAMNKQSASTSSRSFSPESVQSLSHSIARTRHGSAPDLLEEDDTDTSCALSLLERYSEMMVSMVQQKLTQNGAQLSQHTTKPSGT